MNGLIQVKTGAGPVLPFEGGLVYTAAMNLVHGHEVLNMMITSGKIYSKASLVSDIVQKFGADARFHTCSADNMTAEELVAFLESKGKFISQLGGVRASRDLMCGHGHDHDHHHHH